MQANFAALESQAKAAVSKVFGELSAAGGAIVSHVNVAELERIALDAYLKGGRASVLPALEGQVAAWIDPAHVPLVLLIFRLVAQFAAA